MKKSAFLNKNALNTATGLKKADSGKIKPKYIDIEIDPVARDDPPERTDLNRFEASVRPESSYYKSLDPKGLGGLKVEKKSNVFADLRATQPMKVELQKHHIQRAQFRLTEAAKKKSFDNLMVNYFHLNRTETPQAKLHDLVNTPIKPLTPSEIQQVELQLQQHDARLLTDTNAIQHIVASAELLNATKAALTTDQWSNLLRLALQNIFRRINAAPPAWLGAAGLRDHNAVQTDKPAYPAGVFTTDSTGETMKTEEQSDETMREAAARRPETFGTHEEAEAGATSGASGGSVGGAHFRAHTGLRSFFNLIDTALNGQDEATIQMAAHKILTNSPTIPSYFRSFREQYETAVDSENMTTEQSLQILLDAWMWLYTPATRRGGKLSQPEIQGLIDKITAVLAELEKKNLPP